MQAAASEALPGQGADAITIQIPGQKNQVSVHHRQVTHNFLSVYGIPILEGRNFTPQDRANFVDNQPTHIKILISEKAAKALGDIKIGDHILFWSLSAEIIGIFKDFHYRSLHHAIEPLMLVCGTSVLHYITVVVDAQDMPGAIDHLNTVWEAYLPGLTFQYRFVDTFFDNYYRSEFRLRHLYTACTGLAIFVACLGLLGL